MKGPWYGHPDITYITTYYNEPEFLEELLENFDKDHFTSLLIVDDGSMKYPAEPIVRVYADDLPVSLYRVKEDIGFNSHGCRNLAAQESKTVWCYFTDIDMYMDQGVAYELFKATQTSTLKQYFTFWRNFKQDYIGRCEESINDFCIRRKDFLESYGYDEEYAGMHYGDKMFLEKLSTYMVKTLMPNVLIDKRGRRKSVMTNDVDKPTYDNENMIMYHPRIYKDELEVLNSIIGTRNETRSQWETKSFIDFEWEKLI